MTPETTNDVTETTPQARLKRWITPDKYTIAGCLIFVIMCMCMWRGYVGKHEAIYLLGSERVVDPTFLAGDLTWGILPPTTWAYDHLMAPLRPILDDFTIVGIGRVVSWILLSWALTALARTMRIPAWSLVAGFGTWMIWGQTIPACGSLLEGFQPKSFAYPGIFFSLVFAIRGQPVRAGIAAGIATLFHIIVGGWGCLAIFLSMVINRKLFTWREVGMFLVGCTPIILPFVVAVGLFHVGGISHEEETLMNRIYVTFAVPHCCDPTYFMPVAKPWWFVLIVFPVAPLLTFLWPHRRPAMIVTGFISMLILFFCAGMVASRLEFYTLLKVYPFQLANAIPALFLFIVCLSFIWKDLPRRPLGLAGWSVGILAFLALVITRHVFTEGITEVPPKFVSAVTRKNPEQNRYGTGVSAGKKRLYAWIRENTPRDAIFITPYLAEFWIYAERDQVAAFRHPPHDHRIIEWKNRLEMLNGSKPFANRGFRIKRQVSYNESRLTIDQIIRLRDDCGAMYYVARLHRIDLDEHQLFAGGGYYLYEIGSLVEGEARE